MKKQLPLIVLFVVLGILAGYYWSNKGDQNIPVSSTVPTPTRTPFPVPSGILSVLPSPIIQWAKPFSFPSSIHETVAGAAPALLSNISSVAVYFQLSGSPKQIVGSRGTTYVWNNDSRSLSINDSPLSINFSSPASSSLLNKDQTFYETAALNYLKELPFLSSGLEYRQAKTVFLKEKGSNAASVPLSQAQVALCYFDYMIGEFPLYSGSPSRSQAVIGINNEGTVVSLQMVVFPSFTQTKTLLPVRSYESLSTGAPGDIVVSGYITQSENGSVYEQSDISPSAVTISSVLLGYYFDSNTNVVFPVFFITGEGKSPASEKIIIVSFVARASN